MLTKADLNIRTLETEQVLPDSGVSVNRMTSQYKKKVSKPVYVNNHNRRSEWKRCKDCYAKHEPSNCPYKTYTCHRCKKTGHLQSVCKSQVRENIPRQAKKAEDQERTSSVFTCSSPGNEPTDLEFSSNIYQRVGKQIWIDAEINGMAIKCQWDSGSTCSMIGIEGYRQLGSPTCQPSTTSLMAYGGKPLKVKGQCFVDVKIG